MPDKANAPIELLIRYLDLADQMKIPISLRDFDPLLEKLGIEKLSSKHFDLVWTDMTRKGSHLDPAKIEVLIQEYPGWSKQIEKICRFEMVLNAAFGATRSKLLDAVQVMGLQIEKKLKTSQAIDTYLVRRLPESSVQSQHPDNYPFVIKVGFGPIALKLLKKEFTVGRHLEPDFFARPVSMEIKEDLTWITMDYAAGGCLDRVTCNGWAEIWGLWLQLAKGLACLHDKLLCHNDFKASNILVYSNSVKKSFRIGDLQLVTKEGKSVPRYRDKWDHPDWDSGQMARRRDDIYRLGMTIAWLLDPRIILPEFESADKRLELVGQLPPTFSIPLRHCLVDDPMERIDNGTELTRILKGSNASFDLQEFSGFVRDGVGP